MHLHTSGYSVEVRCHYTLTSEGSFQHLITIRKFLGHVLRQALASEDLFLLSCLTETISL